MSTIITEGKKISELPINLGFSNNAVVLISDGGVTTRMLLSSLIDKIKSELSGTDNEIMKKVDALLLRMSLVENKNLSQDKAFTLLEQNTARMTNAQNVNIAACEAVVDQIRYQRHIAKNTDSMRDTQMFLPTSNVTVGSSIDYEYEVRANSNYDVYVRHVLPGTKIEVADASAIANTSYTQNILVCTSPTIGGTVLEVLPVSELLEMHSHTFTSEGYVFINLNRMSGENEILYFYDENNFSNMQTLPEVNTAMNGFVLTVVNGAWTAVPPAVSAYDFDEVVNALRDAGIM